ncbi:MAG: dipicolinate synthase subunit DpsA [Bacillota bacterium]|nr:dipicolinate synthase subunit DpsA [Bacillota bacterium]
MNNNTKFAVIGGDMRFISLAKGLAEKGFNVKIAGFETHVFDNEKLPSGDAYIIAKEADVIVLPLTFSNDNENINAPFSDQKIDIATLFKNISSSSIVLAGKVDDYLADLARERNIKLFDYLDREEMSILNAVPTCEGALELAISEMPITLWESEVLICGYGRVGKMLAKNFDALGARVTVAVRSHKDSAWIRAYGYAAAGYRGLEEICDKFDLIINTVPSLVLDEKLLRAVKDDVLIIDLASKPGGVDFTAAGRLRRKVIWALSLPGKVAPITAGRIIEETVVNIAEEEGF